MAAPFKILGSLKGAKKLYQQISALPKDALERQVNAVREATFLIHEEAVRSIQQNNDGKPAIRYDPKRTVAVSNPGDPPNTDTGRLVQSIKFDFLKNGLIGRVGSNLKYAAFLEFGTKDMEARPWLSSAVQTVSKDIGEIFQRSIKGLGEE